MNKDGTFLPFVKPGPDKWLKVFDIDSVEIVFLLQFLVLAGVYIFKPDADAGHSHGVAPGDAPTDFSHDGCLGIQFLDDKRHAGVFAPFGRCDDIASLFGFHRIED